MRTIYDRPDNFNSTPTWAKMNHRYDSGLLFRFLFPNRSGFTFHIDNLLLLDQTYEFFAEHWAIDD